ncbi:Triose-phosphate isomerase [Alkaliphilus metalliredigens QYMF]|uniref:Triosephosphate isomerase n=1 Tax=Alkaliphilus metalliredigens (strain QYMF) TaxID=293826 RepID=TPIS_ALKMQ|nr:triose-phosphate isomerase [Alkaliphilus metalliredigens]A6TU32.1 RecName: Full=Triosephosphate isomerase; Short=TIM; Short=TPI; AltName: Full=Triose-phosphate isomerase [Alkaliphilus metalliredigens QYMF]ABR49700.1 Triose-phosphate isomerase [Alkaliphilus metalliredigens QYMF]
MRKPIIAGNWKMNKTVAETLQFINEIRDQAETTDVEVVLCCPFTALSEAKKALGASKIKLGAQNMHWEDNGAFTGEISAEMLKELGVDYILIGHSERRQYFNETDETVNKKIKKALEQKLMPILCVGETLQEREAAQTFDVIKNQITIDLEGILPDSMKDIVIAYEPIWAIGTGKTASSQDANHVIAYIRQLIQEKYDDGISETVRIQYGGSVKPENATEIMNEEDIDGALVGGASLKADAFLGIVNF